jgi:hypothetical protein
MRLAVILIGCALVYAQTETPPDLKAYREISKETDPRKKIAALEKWKTDFPQSNMRDNADSTILHTFVTRLPAEQAAIRKFAAAMYKGAAAKDKGYTAYSIADELLDGNLLLRDAEAYARKGLAAMSLPKYIRSSWPGTGSATRNRPLRLS